MQALRVKQHGLNALAAALLGIDLIEGEYIEDPADVIEKRFKLEVFKTLYRGKGSSVSLPRFHLLFEDDASAVEFKLRWSEHLE